MRDKNIQAFWDWLMKGAPMVEDWNVNDPLMTPGMLTVWGHWMQYRAEQDPEWVEHLSAAAHQAWMAEKERQGFADHPPDQCSVGWDIVHRGRPPILCEKLPAQHHLDMVPYDQLPEETKEFDRQMVRVVLTSLLQEGGTDDRDHA